jgi:hypothetical protein
VLGRQLSRMVSDYLHTQIQSLASSDSGSRSFFGASVNAPPSVRKTILYLLSGALLVGAPVLILTKYVVPSMMALLYWMWGNVVGVALPKL